METSLRWWLHATTRWWLRTTHFNLWFQARVQWLLAPPFLTTNPATTPRTRRLASMLRCSLQVKTSMASCSTPAPNATTPRTSISSLWKRPIQACWWHWTSLTVLNSVFATPSAPTIMWCTWKWCKRIWTVCSTAATQCISTGSRRCVATKWTVCLKSATAHSTTSLWATTTPTTSPKVRNRKKTSPTLWSGWLRRTSISHLCSSLRSNSAAWRSPACHSTRSHQSLTIIWKCSPCTQKSNIKPTTPTLHHSSCISVLTAIRCWATSTKWLSNILVATILNLRTSTLHASFRWAGHSSAGSTHGWWFLCSTG